MIASKVATPLYIYFPLDVLQDERLSAADRLLLCLISSLDNEKNCIASNEYLGSVVNCTNGTISTLVRKLQKLGYISNKVTGRRSIRKVLKNFKKRKSEISTLDTSHEKKIMLSSEKRKPIYIEKEKEKDYKEIIIEDEKELVKKHFRRGFKNCWEFYLLFKNEYENRFHIKWDKFAIVELINFCNNVVISHIKQTETLNSSGTKAFLLGAFKIILLHPPVFFNDTHPKTFNRFWNSVIVQIKVEDEIKRLRLRYSSDHGHF